MNRWRAEYDDGIWRFYRDGMELGLYEKGDVVVDALNVAESRIAELSQAVGLITTLKPTMVMDADHPLDMAKEVVEYATSRIAELERDCDMLFRSSANKQSRKNTLSQTFVYGKEREE